MLILPPGHAQMVRTGRRLNSRERWLVGVILGLVLALGAVVVLSLATSGHSTGHGCIDANIPYSIGGQEVYRCGAAARAVCSAVDTSDGFSGAAGRAVAAECRKVSLPVGAASG